MPRIPSVEWGWGRVAGVGKEEEVGLGAGFVPAACVSCRGPGRVT